MSKEFQHKESGSGLSPPHPAQSQRSGARISTNKSPVNVIKHPPDLKLRWLLQVFHRVTVFHSIFDIPCSIFPVCMTQSGRNISSHPVNVIKHPPNFKLRWLLQVIHWVAAFHSRGILRTIVSNGGDYLVLHPSIPPSLSAKLSYFCMCK
jgi:hypothetical protein